MQRLVVTLISVFFFTIQNPKCAAVSGDWGQTGPPLFADWIVLGTFRGTFFFMAAFCRVCRAAKPWWHHRLWLTLWALQSQVQGSVYKQYCSTCSLWPRSRSPLGCGSHTEGCVLCRLSSPVPCRSPLGDVSLQILSDCQTGWKWSLLG